MNWRIIMHNKVVIERKMKQMTKIKATPFRQKGNASRAWCHQSCEQSNLNQEGHCLLTHQAGTGTSLDWAAEGEWALLMDAAGEPGPGALLSVSSAVVRVKWSHSRKIYDLLLGNRCSYRYLCKMPR